MTTLLPDPSGADRRTGQQALLLSVRLKRAAFVLLWFYSTAVVVSLFPLRLFTPVWYLNAADVLMANAPIAITGVSLYAIHLAICPDEFIDGLRSKACFRRFCVCMMILYLAIPPLQVVSGSFFLTQFKTTQQTRLQQLQRQQQLIQQRIASITTIAEMNARLGSVSGPAGQSLEQRRAEIRAALANDLRQLQRTLAQERQQRLLQLLLSSARIVATALATALFFRLLAKPSELLLSQILRTFPHDEHPS